MTQRKPSDVPIHTWVDRLVREAEARGEFDDLPGAGKPLPGIDDPIHEDWWIRQKLRSEDLPSDGLLPPALQLRKEVAGLPENVAHLGSEEAVRAAVREVNQRVAAFIRTPSGPAIPVSPANPDAVVAGWRAAREAAGRAGSAAAAATRPGRVATASARPARRRRRWWWLRRRGAERD